MSGVSDERNLWKTNQFYSEIIRRLFGSVADRIDGVIFQKWVTWQNRFQVVYHEGMFGQ